MAVSLVVIIPVFNGNPNTFPCDAFEVLEGTVISSFATALLTAILETTPNATLISVVAEDTQVRTSIPTFESYVIF